jgi:peptide/nickel transport system substrate-binding protein
LLVQDEGGAGILGSTGEFLSFSDQNLELQPRIAESWSPNDDGTVWTFTIRQGVTFHDGTPLTANDVVQTFEKLINPDGGSANAQSALGGVLSPGSIEAPDDATVVFNLDAANGNFPTLVSSANYNAIIIPADLDPANWGQTFMGTGPFKYESFTPQVGLSVVRNDSYWGTPAIADKLDIKFYDEEAAMVLGLQGDEVDFVEHFSVSGGKALLEDPNVQVIAIRTATHRQLHMRTDKDPFKDKRVRQAIALSIDRNALVQGLWEGKADIGNDSPFAPLYPSTDTSVAQREQDIEQAKQLLADAGVGGFEVQLDTWDGFEIPDLAQLVKNYAEQIGITINLKITDAATYYGDGVFGKSTWLDSVMGITDYGHRPVPNVYLTASLHGDLEKLGVWNSAHFQNPAYDDLVTQYVAALDLDSQRAVAKQIQELLLDETPIVFAYFYNFLSAAKPNLQGAISAATGQYDLSQASFTA